MSNVNGWAVLAWRSETQQESTKIGATTSHSLSINGDFVEISSATQRGAREFLPTDYEWSVSIDRLFVPGDTDAETLKEGQKVAICMKVGNDNFVGMGYVSSMKASAALKDMAQLSVTVQGTSNLRIITEATIGFVYNLAKTFGDGID